MRSLWLFNLTAWATTHTSFMWDAVHAMCTFERVALPPSGLATPEKRHVTATIQAGVVRHTLAG